jgi:hypothetical protein
VVAGAQATQVDAPEGCLAGCSILRQPLGSEIVVHLDADTSLARGVSDVGDLEADLQAGLAVRHDVSGRVVRRIGHHSDTTVSELEHGGHESSSVSDFSRSSRSEAVSLLQGVDDARDAEMPAP